MWQELLMELYCKIQHRIHTDEIHLNAYCVTGISNWYWKVKIHLKTHAGGDNINTGTDWI